MRSGADAFERVDFPRRQSKKTALVQLAVPTSFLITLLSSITRNITRLSVHYIPVNPRIIPQTLLHLSEDYSSKITPFVQRGRDQIPLSFRPLLFMAFLLQF